MNPDLRHTPEQHEMNNIELQNFFAEDFTTQEVKTSWDNREQPEDQESSHRGQLYKKRFDNYAYSVFIRQHDKSEALEFKLVNKEDKLESELVFTQPLNTEDGQWNLAHRIIRSQDAGVTGTKFLHKAESFLRGLDTLGYKKIDKIFADASQESVINWLQKNNFNFATEQDRQEYQNYQDSKEDYEGVVVYDENGTEKDPYLIKKADLEIEPLKSLISNVRDDGIKEAVFFNHGNKVKIPRSSYIRVKLEKEL